LIKLYLQKLIFFRKISEFCDFRTRNYRSLAIHIFPLRHWRSSYYRLWETFFLLEVTPKKLVLITFFYGALLPEKMNSVVNSDALGLQVAEGRTLQVGQTFNCGYRHGVQVRNFIIFNSLSCCYFSYFSFVFHLAHS
jgi:hypothetical protein